MKQINKKQLLEDYYLMKNPEVCKKYKISEYQLLKFKKEFGWSKKNGRKKNQIELV